MSDSVTVDTLHTGQEWSLPSAFGVRVLCHPDLKRIDDIAVLFDVRGQGEAQISRQEPSFRSRSGALAGPLSSLRVSRRPVVVRKESAGGVELAIEDDVDFVLLDERPLRGKLVLSPEEIERGVLIRLGKHVLLWMGQVSFSAEQTASSMLRGESRAMVDLRAEVLRIADLPVSILLRGEGGSGKESIARAIHAAGPAASSPFVSLHASMVPVRGNALELFREHAGASATSGTLFIDEIASASADVQAFLGRALDQAAVPSAGAPGVRLMAAIDSEATSGGASSRPRASLQRRFGYQLTVPSLRQRRADIAGLFVSFLEEEMGLLGEAEQLTNRLGDDAAAWIPAEFMARLVLQDWPGNMRELRNAARRFAVYNRGRSVSSVPGDLLSGAAQSPERNRPSEKRVSVSDLKDEQIAEALDRNAFVVDATAEDLGVSRSWLHTHLNESAAFRKAKDLTTVEIQAAMEKNGGDITAAGLDLKVSRRGLQLQMSRLGMRAP